MAPVIIVAGAGPGISAGVAEKWAANGHNVALLSRTQSKLDEMAKEIGAKSPGVKVKGFAVDLSDSNAVAEVLEIVKSDLGPVSVIHWNAFGPSKSLLAATPEDISSTMTVAVSNLLVAVQKCLPDLEAAKGGVLITGGGLSLETDGSVTMAVNYGIGTLALAKAVQRKMTHILHVDLEKKGIYVAEVTVCGAVKGTPFAGPEGGIPREKIADLFWDLYSARDPKVWNKPIM
ncbi:hypothetical protein DFJ74DRAFT_712199 [Hyaloraphidium curvatum]|nr:hypothetical protein DFJ74DRAFT_712199 [Hyaloraphidium curvatum]